MALLSDPPPPTPPEVRAAPDPPVPWPWWAAFAAGFGLYLGIGIVVAGIAAATGVTDGGDLPDRLVLGATFVQDVALIALSYFVAATSGGHALWHLGVRRTRPGRGLLWAVGAFVAFFAFLLVWQLVLDIEESDDLAQELGAEDSTINLIAVALLVCVAAPIAEEVFFRGLLFGGLRRSIGWIGGALVTGLVFGLVHAGGTDAVFLVPLAVLGALLCVLYRVTGSLIPGMGLHAFNNAMALGVTLGWEGWQIATAIVVAPAVVVAIATAVAVPQRPTPAEQDAGPAPPAGPAGPAAPLGAAEPERQTLWLPPTPPR